MWSGFSSSIPSGWLLCDGTNGTPDLRDRFVRGTDEAGIGATGGSDSITLAVGQLPAHSHAGTTDAGGDHNHGGSTGLAGLHNHGGFTGGSGAHTHTHTLQQAGAHTHTVTGATRQTPNPGNPPFLAVNGPGADTASTSSAGLHTHTLTIDPVGNHDHTIPLQGDHAHTISPSGTHTHTFATGNTGNGDPIDNRPSFYQLAFLMKA